MRALRIRCCSIGGPPYQGPPSPLVLEMVDPRSTCPTGGPPVHPGGPRGSTYSRMSGPPPEQVDPHVLGYGSVARGPDGWSAGLVTPAARTCVKMNQAFCPCSPPPRILLRREKAWERG